MKRFLSLFFLVMLVGCGQGPQGERGLQGERGEPGESIVGPTGPTGNDGSDGKDGQDATPVTVVQLCPGTTHYPTTFVEVAFCIGGKLYATYSTHGGFSTEIPPGTYSSNGVGSSCTFTVGANCQVTSQ